MINGLPIHGHKYWCCKQSLESDNYSTGMGFEQPREPWEGILTVEQRGGGIVYLLHSFNQDNVIDEDSNAMAIVSFKDLFDTKWKAVIHYKKECFEYANALLGEAAEYFDKAFNSVGDDTRIYALYEKYKGITTEDMQKLLGLLEAEEGNKI